MPTKIYKCLECGVQFNGYKAHEKYGRNKFCSFKCNGRQTKTHGLSDSTLYRKFKSVQQRCRYVKSKHYKSYGGRGIKCLWDTFEEFYKDMASSYEQHVAIHGKKNSTLDRIDNNGDYCKENCRWLTVKEQCYNKSNNVALTVEGRKMFLKEIADHFGIKESTVRTRYARGWTTKDLIKKTRKYGT